MRKNSLLRMAVMLPRSKSSAPHDGIYTLLSVMRVTLRNHHYVFKVIG